MKLSVFPFQPWTRITGTDLLPGIGVGVIAFPELSFSFALAGDTSGLQTSSGNALAWAARGTGSRLAAEAGSAGKAVMNEQTTTTAVKVLAAKRIISAPAM
ncbi:hypothetical protein GCM10023063_19770 [Arthrobacter methylotrophus]